MIVWRYLLRGTVKHAVGQGVNGWVERVAECGVGPDLFDDWYGTGNQNEYEEVEHRPACRRCTAMGYKPEEKK
jgi:hypothetical protein